ncbi:Hypothetical protein R9X50_00599100 [Acrodontium crateriforme]|uniref:Mitotic checkpoint regulator, MAD2B-interacting-domain-containing protein n=1 Tax=Acrodontium crateriforme TaxID=150365 RepID=A0AAQ3MAU0_9PEZI|nr:Hypothetical protein R9X50_00599100 [Acrodontium crateriforme]
MGLVSYSDSESSDDETQPPPTTKPTSTTKPAFQRTEPRKIAVSLPFASTSGATADDIQPPAAKRARTGGAFSGFNSLLPAPKRTVEKAAGLGRGVNLKTSSEAAFSRRPVPSFSEDVEGDTQGTDGGNDASSAGVGGGVALNANGGETKAPEVKIVGQATRFKPLSVANNKKKKGAKKPVQPASEEGSKNNATEKEVASASAVAPAPPPEKKKQSLFSLPQEETQSIASAGSEYISLMAQEDPMPSDSTIPQPFTQTYPERTAPSNSLVSTADDLNLTAAERRQLFGRGGAKNKDVAVTHFRTDAEYAANEQLRQQGDAFEHRAVKSIAPGKHSLQQLVNNARQNEEAIEDKWAEGRAKRAK